MNAESLAVAQSYVNAINERDPARFAELFAENAVVDDNGRIFRGREAIAAWSRSDIFELNVSLEPRSTGERDGRVVVTTKVDGDFDRTGLPDPVVIDQHIEVAGGRIVAMACRLEGHPITA